MWVAPGKPWWRPSNEVASRGEHLGSSAVGHQEEVVAAQLVLLEVVDAKRAVEPRRPEAVPLHRVGGVDVRPRIDDECLAAEGELERELVVVAVSAAPVTTCVATADDHVVLARAEDVVAPVRVRGARRRGLELLEEVAVVARVGAVVSEREEATVVRVADLRGEPVGPRVVANEVEHALEPLAVPVGQAVRNERIGRLGAADEQLGDEPVIAGRGLVRRAVLAHLMLELRDELAGRPFRPLAAFPAAGEERGDREQADDVGEVVVAASLAPFQMRAHEAAVEQEARQHALEPGLAGGVLCGDRERGDPVRGADGCIHRRSPVGAELGRVVGDPALELGTELVEIPSIPGQPVGGREERQVLPARELPRHLDVRPVAVGEAEQGAVTKRPAPSGLEVRSPVDLAAEVGGPGSEEVEAVGEGRIGTLEDVLARLELEAGDGRHGRQDRAA